VGDGASAASALQLPAAIASSSAAKNDSPGKGPYVRRPSPSAYFKKPQKTQSNKTQKWYAEAEKTPKVGLRAPYKQPIINCGDGVDNSLSDSDSQNPH